jgi:hypothetical protein
MLRWKGEGATLQVLKGLCYGTRMQVIRFRKLTSHGTHRDSLEVIQAARRETLDLDLMPFGSRNPGSPPRQVDAHEGTGNFTQVRTLLLSGDLKLSDLVDVGEGWQTFDECLLFDAERARLLRRASLKRWGLVALLLGGVLLVAYGYSVMTAPPPAPRHVRERVIRMQDLD